MKKEFRAVIQQHETKNAAFIEPPFDIEEVYGAKRVKVKATFDGVEYQGSIVSMGNCYMLGLTQEIRTKINKTFGDEILVTVEKDEEERKVTLPEDLAAEFDGNPEAYAFFQTLSFTNQKEYVVWITSAKRESTRLERLEKTMAQLSEGRKLR